MAQPGPRPRRKRPGQYHHGDLRRALVEEAVRVIQAQGVHGLTLRAAGARLGVSRTALYRHFPDKAALLEAVAAEGFRMLRTELASAWGRGGRAPFDAMGFAYVRFAVTHPSHYRVMFGGVLGDHRDPDLLAEGTGAFEILVQAIVALQHAGEMRADDPLQMARFIWSIVHGLAMLAIDGQIAHQGADVDDLTRFALDRLRTGVGP